MSEQAGQQRYDELNSMLNRNRDALFAHAKALGPDADADDKSDAWAKSAKTHNPLSAGFTHVEARKHHSDEGIKIEKERTQIADAWSRDRRKNDMDRDLDWLREAGPSNDIRRALARHIGKVRKDLRWMTECLDMGYYGQDEEEKERHKVERIAEQEPEREFLEDRLADLVGLREAWGRRTREQRNEEFARKARRRALADTRNRLYKASREAQAALEAEDAEHGRYRHRDKWAADRAELDAGCCHYNVRHQQQEKYRIDNPHLPPFFGGEHSKDCEQYKEA